MNAFRKAALLACLSAPGAALLGCPPQAEGECQNYTDCRSGQTCDPTTHQCVVDPLFGGGGSGGVTIPGGDGGPNDEAGRREVDTDNPVPWLERVSLPGGEQLVFADFDGNDDGILRDQVRPLDPVTGDIGDEIVDLQQASTSACGVERVEHFTETDHEETWFSCRQAPWLRVAYDGDLDEIEVEYPGHSAELTLLTGPALSGDNRRVLAAKRGASTFTSFELRPDDGRTERLVTDGTELPFGAIAGFFPVDRAGENGDFVLVFDRAWPGYDNENASEPVPALVPIERPRGSQQWIRTSALDPLELEPETHAVLVLSPPKADGNPDDNTVPNVMTFEAETGFARYYNFETGNLIGDVQFESASSYLAQAPAPEMRILLSRSGEHVFYTHQDTYRIWRVPTGDDRDDEVRFYEVRNSSWRPSGLVADDEEWVWVSYGGDENRIERVRTSSR